jgi:hypothetical protein
LKISTRSFGYALFWQTEHLGAALILNPRGMECNRNRRSFITNKIPGVKLGGRQAAQPEAAGIYRCETKRCGMLIVERCNVGGWNGHGIGE